MPVGRDLVELPSADALNHTRNARVWTWGHACMYLRGKSTTCAPCYYIQYLVCCKLQTQIQNVTYFEISLPVGIPFQL